MTITIEDLKFQCIIGILDFERIKPQDVIINIEIDYIYSKEFINYADVSEFLKQEMINERFLLIEDALTHLINKFKERFPLINSLTLKITKPTILSDCTVSVSDSVSFNS